MNLISADGQFLAEATSQHPDKELGRRKPPEQSVPFIFGKTPIGYVPHSESCVLDLVSAFGAIRFAGLLMSCLWRYQSPTSPLPKSYEDHKSH